MNFENRSQITSELIAVVDNELHLHLEDGQVVVSSRVVAERFNKRHSDVVRVVENKIESLTTQNCKVKNLFIESVFNHNGNTYKEYLLTRDGFTFIVMGFTGSEVDEWLKSKSSETCTLAKNKKGKYRVY